MSKIFKVVIESTGGPGGTPDFIEIGFIQLGSDCSTPDDLEDLRGWAKGSLSIWDKVHFEEVQPLPLRTLINKFKEESKC